MTHNPPAWLAAVPSHLILQKDTHRLLDFLRRAGLPRPSLLDLDAARRARREETFR